MILRTLGVSACEMRHEKTPLWDFEHLYAVFEAIFIVSNEIRKKGINRFKTTKKIGKVYFLVKNPLVHPNLLSFLQKLTVIIERYHPISITHQRIPPF